MSLCRSVSMLHLCGQTPRVLSHTKRSFSVVSDSSSFSRFRFRLISFSRLDVKWICGFSTSTTNTAAEAERKENDTFFADDAVSWNSLGLSDRLSRALCKSGFGKPSLTQAACIPSIMSGKDVIVAAETGSGKTHGYLAPVINKLCSPPADSDESCNDQTPIPRNRTSLVLCPNVLLCEQVVRMANGLLDDDGNPLVKVEAVCGTQGWPVKQPDIIVSTPAALLNNIDPKRKRRLDFLRRVQFVIFDEADMLLCGSFQNQVIRLINMLRFDEKQLSRLNKSGLTKPTELNGGGSITSPEMNNEDDEENDDESILGDEEEEEEESFSGEEEDSDADIPNIEVLTEETRSNPRKDWRRIRKIYDRSKQYIFVAATLPVNGKKTAGAVLKHMFPEAIWVSGNFLHHHSPRLKQKWIQVTVETQVDALIEAVNNGLKIEGLDCNTAEINRTMVFANTVEAVEAVANILQRTGKECFRYHKNHSLEERSQIISDFRDKGGIFVCTDAAARGVDIPNVFHVIQADFATSAVDFLHRVGRTARAGHYGLVTSLYTEANKDLVEAIHQAAKAGRPVEMAFSRKRSFRNKIKKRGSSKDRDGERDEFVIAQ